MPSKWSEGLRWLSIWWILYNYLPRNNISSNTLCDLLVIYYWFYRHHTYALSNGTLVRRSASAQQNPPTKLLQHSKDSMMFLNHTAMNRIIRASKQKRKPLDDYLSKNISFLLENLLKRYENSHLPTHGQGNNKKKTIKRKNKEINILVFRNTNGG